MHVRISSMPPVRDLRTTGLNFASRSKMTGATRRMAILSAV